MSTFPPEITDTVKNVSTLASEVSHHLRNVYLSLLGTSLAAACGILCYLHTHLNPTVSFIFAFIFLISIVATSMRSRFVPTPITTSTNKQFGISTILRLSCLLAFGFFNGATAGALVEHALEIDPKIVLLSVIGTSTIFGCFSASALLAKRRTYLFLGGFLSSSITMLLWMMIFYFFFQWNIIVEINIYFGLLVFCGFVLYDTQVIIEKINNGDDDFVAHAADLFIDLFGIFVRILIILGRRSND
eukprot:TRINITY_DN6794_c0_g1_i1.p1 TRINITY_DN6794_c0_g1~~TRINITY_DN6794_c0_g1_i1.p1  ORF type:complete len:252 (+),score=35.58 TRINITY_DN6794_c0_g1_i1:24-758(+)